jgi:branched-chain amino acid transport system permease protein
MMRTAFNRNRLAFALFWVLLLVFPAVAPNPYIVNLGVFWLVNLILLASLNLLMGYGGQISLSHAAFFGLGAYTSGVLSAKFGISPWLGSLAAVFLTAALAALIGLPTLRLKGHYLAMATLGFNAVISVLFIELRGLTGGPNGLTNVPSFDLFGFELAGDVRFFYFAWVVTGVVLLLVLNLLDSRMGRALRALSTSEVAAESMGVPVFRYKVQLFVLTAAMAAVAGCLYVHHINFASPETFDFMASVMMVVVVALGGTGTFWGPFLAAFVFVALPELLHAFEGFELLLFGVSLVVVLLFFPRGLAGLLGLRPRPRRAKPAADASPAAPVARMSERRL